MANETRNPVELNDETLDQANGGLIGLLKVAGPEAQANTYRGTTQVNQGVLSAHGSGGGGGAGKVSMQDIH